MSFKVPNKITIGGVDYTVTIKDPPVNPEHPVQCANVNFRTQEILISNDMGEDMVGVSFCHEILHAINELIGIPDGGSVEMSDYMVDCYAHLLYQVVKQL